jgi:hypothetical protein
VHRREMRAYCAVSIALKAGAMVQGEPSRLSAK